MPAANTINVLTELSYGLNLSYGIKIPFIGRFIFAQKSCLLNKFGHLNKWK